MFVCHICDHVVKKSDNHKYHLISRHNLFPVASSESPKAWRDKGTCSSSVRAATDRDREWLKQMLDKAKIRYRKRRDKIKLYKDASSLKIEFG